MIKWVHGNKRSLAGFLIICAVVLSMSFFGVDISNKGSGRPAIKINGSEISHEQFQHEKNKRQQALINQYRNYFGENYRQFAQNIFNMPNSQVVDAIVAEYLIVNKARDFGLRAGAGELQRTIKDVVFQGGFDQQMYEAYLTQMGTTSRAFENDLRESLVTQQLQEIVQSMSEPSDGEVRANILRSEAVYEVSYLDIDPQKFEEKVDTKDNAKLEEYFKEHQTDYEIPPQVNYKYVVFDPAKFEKDVEVLQEDVELFYSDNESRFTTKPEAKARHILISYPKDADSDKRAEIAKRADEAHAKANAGEDFAALVSQYSDDITTSLNGGELGWVKPGEKDKKFDDSVFKLTGPGVAGLIERGDGFEIVRIDEYKAAELKKLDDVRAEIEGELRKDEAPAYSSAAAQEAFAKWDAGKVALPELAGLSGLEVKSIKEPFTKSQDPEDANLKGLTARVFEAPEQEKQLIELKDRTVLVEVTKFEESRLPPFDAAREKVAADYRKVKAKDLAAESAGKALELINGGMDLKETAKKLVLAEPQTVSMTRREPGSAPLAQDKELREKIFSTYNAPAKPKEFLNRMGRYFLIAVDSITPPSDKTVEEKLGSYRTQVATQSARIANEAILNHIKAEADIDADPAIMADPESAAADLG